MQHIEEQRQALRIDGAVRTNVGRQHDENQDAVGFFPDLSLYAIADGVGGHAAGHVASTLSIEAVRTSVIETGNADLTPVAAPSGCYSVSGRQLLIAVQNANDRVAYASQNDPQLRGMAAALAAVLFERKRGLVAICNVGDARVYRIRGERVEQLTEDQTVVQQLLRAGRIDAEDVEHSPHRHMLTQAIGSHKTVQPGLRLEEAAPGDVFLLSSDGLHDVVAPDDIPAALQQAGSNLDQACARLIELAKERGARDDITVLLLSCAPEVNKADTPPDTC
jgi:serine/threonine protein phosphatase PrpC